MLSDLRSRLCAPCLEPLWQPGEQLRGSCGAWSFRRGGFPRIEFTGFFVVEVVYGALSWARTLVLVTYFCGILSESQRYEDALQDGAKPPKSTPLHWVGVDVHGVCEYMRLQPV
jgi:hypothetical protein